MKFLNINSELTWKSDFDISQTVIPFEKESIKELKKIHVVTYFITLP